MSLILDAIGKLFKSSHAEDFKAVMTELRELKNEYKEQAKDEKKRIDALEAEIRELKIMEIECLKQQVLLVNRVRDLEEKLIFKTKGKHKDDEI